MKVLRAGGALQNASRSSTISHYGFTFARRAHGVRESIGQRLSWRCVLRIHEYVSYGTVPYHDYGHGVAGVRRRPGEARRSAARSPQTRRKKARLLPPLFSASFVRRPARAPSVASQCRAGRSSAACECVRSCRQSSARRAVVVRRAACLVGYRVSHIMSLFFSNYTHHVRRSALSTTRTRQQSQRPVLTCRATHGTLPPLLRRLRVSESATAGPVLSMVRPSSRRSAARLAAAARCRWLHWPSEPPPDPF